jgi:hypothetical protein
VSTSCAHVGSRRRSAVISNNISDIAIARGVHRCVVVRRMRSHTTVVTHTTLGTPSAKYSSQVVHAIWVWTTCSRLRKVHSRTSSLSVVDIVPTHCVKEKKQKHSSGSYHTNHSSQVVHAIWAWITCLRLRKVHSRTSSLSVVDIVPTHCVKEKNKNIQMVRPSLMDSRLRPPPHTLSKESSTVRAKPMGRQYQTARMKLMFIMSCSSINSRQHVTAIKNQDSSLKAVLLPRISTFGACSCRSLHHKTVSLTIRCDSTSKQGSLKQKLTTSKHISSFSHCQKPV